MVITRAHVDEEWMKSILEYRSQAKRSPFHFVPFPADRILEKPPDKLDWRKRFLFLDESTGERIGWILIEEEVDETTRWSLPGFVMMAAGFYAGLWMYWNLDLPRHWTVFLGISLVSVALVPGALYWLMLAKPWRDRMRKTSESVQLDDEVWEFLRNLHAIQTASISASEQLQAAPGAVAGSLAGSAYGAIVGKAVEKVTTGLVGAVSGRYFNRARQRRLEKHRDAFSSDRRKTVDLKPMADDSET